MKPLVLLMALGLLTFGLPQAAKTQAPSQKNSLEKQLQSLKSDPETANDPYFKSLAEDAKSASGKDRKADLNDLANGIRTKKLLLSQEQPGKAEKTKEDSTAQARKILSSPFYTKSDTRTSGNWIQKALGRIFRIKFDPKVNVSPIGLGSLSSTVSVLMWALIIAFVLGFAYLAYRLFIFPNGKKRRGSMVSEDELGTDSDEWLSRSAEWARQGDFRQAIRCGYIAGLLYFDSAKLARFDRTETNWQHLNRIEHSPNLPAGIQYRKETNLFDGVWYGMHPAGKEECESFITDIKSLKLSLGVKSSNSRETPDYDEPIGSGAK